MPRCDSGTPCEVVSDLLANPGVAATVIHRMAEAHTLAGRVAPEACYAPFASNRFPPGVSPAAVLGTFRNFQAQFLSAWVTAVLRGRAPRDVSDLVDIYGAAFPAERAEVIRIFVVTTFGATVKAGGVSTNPKNEPRALADLTALTAAAVAADCRFEKSWRRASSSSLSNRNCSSSGAPPSIASVAARIPDIQTQPETQTNPPPVRSSHRAASRIPY
jgi:hypothetical protein